MARVLDRLLGQRETLMPLIEAAAEVRLAPSLIFAGPSGIGKRLAALALAQCLVCEKKGKLACGECGACLRMGKGSSESLLQVAPDGAQIKIEQARDVTQFLSLRTLGRARVVLIDQAHLLGPQAANALLKTLEEPPQNSYFILVTPHAAALLPTIRSRAQLVRFRPLSDENVKKILGADADDWLVAEAQGSVEAAARMNEARQEFEEVETAVANYLDASFNGFPSQEITKLRELIKERVAQSFAVSLIQSAVRDGMKIQGGLHSERAKFPTVAQKFSALQVDRLHSIAQASLGIEADLARNVDRALIFENFAMTVRGRVQ